MAITINSVQKRRIVNQIEQNLTGLQRDMHNNALTHKAMAQAQNPAAPVLRVMMDDCANTYLGRLQWIIDLRNDAVRRQRLLDMLSSAGWTEQEIVDYVTELRSVAIQMRDATKNTYAQMIAICDGILAEVQKPESLWPE